ncbi:MAG: hypothetical protein J6S28_09970 [Clostridia bacterium]|nr:hypothetical protein [Clostridia bacterium]MBO7295838.1 hypothetical protein [Clostridia bacterium]
MRFDQSKLNKATRWRLVRPAILLLLTVLLFSYVSYAWLNRQWTPSIKQDGITISTSSSLVFLLDKGDTTTSMRIDQVLDLDKDFVLRPVSNASGRSQDFVTLNMAGEEKDYHYQHITPPETSAVPDYSQLGIENGYIEFNMALGSVDTAASKQYIYLHHDSRIAFHGDATSELSRVVNCIRISLTIRSGSESISEKTYIFVPDTVATTAHMGVDPKKDGVKYFDTETEVMIPPPITTEVKHLKDCMAGRAVDSNGEETFSPTDDNTLFTLEVDPDTSAPVWITVRIWAEGTDANCDDTIAGQQIDLMLKFAAIEAQ